MQLRYEKKFKIDEEWRARKTVHIQGCALPHEKQSDGGKFQQIYGSALSLYGSQGI